MQVTEETKALAQQMLDYWELENRHEQHYWVAFYNLPRDTELVSTKNQDGVEFNVCNTTMCAAGTVVFLTETAEEFKRASQYEISSYWTRKASPLLGLDASESRKLFYAKNNDKAKLLVQAIAEGDQELFDNTEVQTF